MRLEIQYQERPYAMDLPCDLFDDLDTAALRRWAEKLEQQLAAAQAELERLHVNRASEIAVKTLQELDAAP